MVAMKLSFSRLTSPTFRPSATAVTAALALICLSATAAPPAWWQARGVLDSNQTHNDFAAVNTGQLKHIAKQAMLELDAKLPGGAGTAIHQLVDAWPQQTAGRNDFSAVNVGQVKAIAQLFYDRLNQAGYAQTVPWTNAIQSQNDYAAANVGQLKMVFSLCIDCAPIEDTDFDGVPDWWEIQHFGNLNDASGDSDQDKDGLSDFWERIFLTNPNSRDTDGDGLGDGHEIVTFAGLGLSAVNAHSRDPIVTDSQWLSAIDSDGDGINDRWEIANNLDPHNSADAIIDQEGDGLTAEEEHENQSDPWSNDTDFDGIPDGSDGADGEYANDPFNGQYPWQSIPLGGASSNQGRRIEFGTSVQSEIFDGHEYVTLTIIRTASGQVFYVPENGYEPFEPLFGEQIIVNITKPRLRRLVVTVNLANPNQAPWLVAVGFEKRNNMILVDFDSADGDPEWWQGPPYDIEHPDATPTPPEVKPLLPVEFKEHDSESGFDNFKRATKQAIGNEQAATLERPWLMVPGGGDRAAKAYLSGAGTSVLQLAVRNGAQSITPQRTGTADPLEVTIQGAGQGEQANVEVENARSLDLVAYDKKTLEIAVWAVTLVNDDQDTNIKPGKGKPNSVCVRARGNILFTNKAGDDVANPLNGYITTGPDGICQTTADSHDDQIIQPTKGEADAVITEPGANALRNTKPLGDDAITGQTLTTGPDGIRQTPEIKPRIAPVNVPSKAQLKNYLDTIYGKQMNVYFTVAEGAVDVSYDVAPGVDDVVTPPVGNPHPHPTMGINGMFDFFYNDAVSSEEKLIGNLAFNSNAKINVYYFGTPINECDRKSDETNSNIYGKAREIETNEICYISTSGSYGSGETIVSLSPEEVMWTTAHEIGHTGNLKHPRIIFYRSDGTVDDRGAYGVALATLEDDRKRLMMGPPQFLTNPKTGRIYALLIKPEWDEFRKKWGF
jgi:hypothetical protein